MMCENILGKREVWRRREQERLSQEWAGASPLHTVLV
jgi:hypothetical protein